MTALRHFFCFLTLFLLMMISSLTPGVHAATKEDFRPLSGLWVVNYDKTEELWKTSKKSDMDILPILAEAYMLDMDFSARTMIEGTDLSETPRRIPFSESRDGAGNLLITIKENGENKTFLWEERSDGNMLVTVDKMTPSIVMMRCDYSKYAGKWLLDTPSIESLVELLANDAPEPEKEDFRTKLADSYLILSFSRGDFMICWETGAGETIYRPFPSGPFSVSQYAKTDCWVSNNEISISFKSDDHFIMFFKDDDVSLSLKRTSE